MGRGKTATVQPVITPGANNPRLIAGNLKAEIERLRSDLAQYAADDAERQRAWEEYHRIEDKIQDSAEPGSTIPVENVTIEWLFTHNSECRRARVTIPDAWDKPVIFAKGDEQLGHVTCDEPRVIKDIDWIEKNPQCLVFLLGDCIDAATKTSPSSIRENNRSPLQQIEAYVDMHKRIANRVIGLVGGNHERRIDKALDEGGGAVRLLAKGLSADTHKVPYSSGLLMIDVHWRGFVWTFTLFHGAGAAATPGSKIQRMQRNMLLTDSLITLSGHLHEEAKTSRRYERRMPDGTINIVKTVALQCGTYMKYVGSYGEIGGMGPVGPDMIVIELFPDGKYKDTFKGESDS